ncbi:BQ2448_4636 [Microbotryum intermedium]|uniref:BQ2448_4636 protein n=1 Tax=Microbotryum intermedium TaxID=269621 RepID=A0A238FDP1_9BASI|nr:BQ2448_4636 [Microbotryum intermedium]
MTRPSAALLAHKSSNPTHIAKCLPRMSWAPANLYNLYQRTYGPPTSETKFTKSSMTLFQQKWKAKQLARGYHGDWITESTFKKQFLPDSLPPIIGTKSAMARGGAENDSASRGSLRGGRHSTTKTQERVPLASLMFAEVEKRLDTVVFRCCFANSVYRARMMVVHGKVSVNGVKCTNANMRLQPGDLISVIPSAVTTLKPAKPTEHVTESVKADELSSEAATSEQPTEASTTTPESPTEASASTTTSTSTSTSKLPPPPSSGPQPLEFELPDFAAPFLFIPPYLEVSWTTCSAIYLRHPTAGPGMSEVPSPYEADGEVMKLTWEYYSGLGRKGDKRPARLVGKRLGA